MVAPRPVDRLPTPSGFAMSRLDALKSGRCARCAVVVTTDPDLHEDDLKEWEISALCPECWDYAMKDCEE